MGVFIIAEAGVNHNGDINIAKKLVNMAVECRADAIKFQTFKAEESTGVFAEKAQYQKDNDSKKESQVDMIRRLELPFEYFKEIQDYCNNMGIIFISTPDGTESLNYLVSLDVPFIKIGSTEVTNLEFLKELGRAGKPMILSTGMSNLGEVEKALYTIYSTGNRKVKLMHCTTDYPTKVEDVNLRAMITMREAFKIPVGFSDHTLSFEAAIAAVAMGAELIEKHITINRDMEGPDHKASMPQKEFKEYVMYIRNTEKLLGSGVKEPTENEIKIMKNVRRSIVAACEIKKGTVLEKSMFDYKRPGYGIKPEFADILIGRKVKKDFKRYEPILWKYI